MITWYMLFTVFMNNNLYSYSTFMPSYIECNTLVRTMEETYITQDVPSNHMAGRCIQIETLEAKPDNSKPELLR